MKHARWLMLLGVLLALPVTAVDAEPSADKILDGFVKATGGAKAYAKIENRVTEGVLEIPAVGVSMNLTIYHARPNKNYTLIESEALGKIEKGTDGEVVWEISTMAGPQVKEGQERMDMLRESHFDKWTNWREVYAKAAYAGQEEVDGTAAHKIVMTGKDGKEQTVWFDAESKLLIKHHLVVDSQMGAIPMESFAGDYREVDGILLPHKTRIKVMQQERVMTIESIRHNVDLPPDRFDIPAEIEAIKK